MSEQHYLSPVWLGGDEHIDIEIGNKGVLRVHGDGSSDFYHVGELDTLDHLAREQCVEPCNDIAELCGECPL